MTQPPLSLPTLTTRRLVLRPFQLADAADVQRLAGDWAIADTTLHIPHPYPNGAAEEWILRYRRDADLGGSVTLAITMRTNGALVGAISLDLDRRYDRAEMGYWIGRPYWGQGFCTEAALALVRYGFEQLGLNRIYAFHFTRNPASGRVMQKIGMQYEGTLRQHIKKWDRYEDVKVYGILRGEWNRERGV
ncbi:MAG: GNAT family N-acetyltransferase [Anaerolineae bacterium]|nr:GNAT family N-acetyltransferase [Anaerolineae bacterium]